MVGLLRYYGDVEQAARLQAARSSAGIDTARAAAQRFGWAEARYLSHEGAKRRLGETDLQEYAQAFAVSPRWLRDGVADKSTDFRDSQIEVDPHRLLELQLRIQEQNQGKTEDQERGRRLRLARRLAGYRTAAAAAAAAGGLHRSTINVAERGLSGFDRGTARVYAAAFGCEADWLLDGRLPSGYPPEVEAELGRLLKDHERSEDDAISRLPAYKPKLATSVATKTKAKRSTPLVARGAPLPEYEFQGLVRLLAERSDRGAEPQGWSLPYPFIEGVLDVDADTCVMLIVPTVLDGSPLAVSAGDRLIVDTAVTSVIATIYVLVRDGMLVVADARTNEGLELARAAASKSEDMLLLGRIVGIVAALR